MEDKSIYNKKKTGRKTRQKGFGWYGSLKPNAGDVEKNVEIFNTAQPDGGIGAVNPVNGNAMGEDMEQEKPKRYPLYMWKALEDAVAGMSNIPDGHKEKFISLVGDRATVKRVPGVGHKSALLPTSLRNKYGYTNANYNTLVTRPENFDITLEQGLTDIYDVMKSKWFKDDLSEATYFTQPEGSWNRDNSAELDAERKERESHKDSSKRVKVIDPKDYNKYKTGTVGEVYTDRHGDEIYRVKLDDDVQDRYIPFKKEQLKFIGNKSINEGLYGYQTFIRTGERGKPIYTLTYGQSNGFIVRYNKNDYLLTFGKEWGNHIKAILEWLRTYQPNYFVKKYEDGSISSFTPNEAEAIEYIKEEIRRGLVLTEATASIKYSYTGPIYHLGNKIAEKSRMFTMAKSFAQAVNNFRYKAANGDIVGHYNIVDEFIKEVPKATLDTPAIEEKPEIVKCDNCGTQLNPMGKCPVCDYGEDDLLESVHIDSNLDALSQLNRMDEIV